MKKILLFLFLFPIITFAQSQTATETKILGVTAAGSFTYILVNTDGKIITSNLPVFSDGANEASALLDASNSVNVNIKNDTKFTATKTSTNAIASDTAQSIYGIANQRRLTIILNESGKEIWVDFGVDAGVDKGIRVTNGVIFDDINSSTVVSYYAASGSVKIVYIQE
jgi:hypothetical protein